MKWIDVPQCLKQTKGKEVPPADRSTSLRLGTPVGAESGKKAVLISKEVDGGAARARWSVYPALIGTA